MHCDFQTMSKKKTMAKIFALIRQSTKYSSIVALIAIASGCSSSLIKPDLYPNKHLLDLSKTEVDRDIVECNDLAETYVNDSARYNKIARETATGAAIGSASGALAGVITGANVGRSVGAGAAVGAIVPLLQRLFSSDQPSPNREKFVELCLGDRGYQVLGR